MASISCIFVDFVARTAGFQQGVEKAAGIVKKGGKEMEDANNKASASNAKLDEQLKKGALQVGIGADRPFRSAIPLSFQR